jgi:TolB-like protein
MIQMEEELRQMVVSWHIGTGRIPDGITIPYTTPRRDTILGSIGRLFGRKRSQGRVQGVSFVITPSGEPRDTSLSPDSSAPPGPQKRLAVLPFRNLSGDAEVDFLGISLADSVITEVAQVKSVFVPPSSAVAAYQNQFIDPARIGAELKVDSILMGNFLKVGDRLRVTAQLVDSMTGEILWSEKIDADAKDVLTVQDRISRRIIEGLAGGEAPLDPTQLLKDENDEIRLDAVRTLKFSRDPRALPALVEALRDQSLKVKAGAVDAVVQWAEEATGPVIQILHDALDERDHLTARFSAKALGLIGDRSISSILIDLLKGNDTFVACEAALALGRLGEHKAVADLTAMLDDPNGNVRFAAAEALGQICDPTTWAALQGRLSDEDEGVRAKARWALSRMKRARVQVAKGASSSW